MISLKLKVQKLTSNLDSERVLQSYRNTAIVIIGSFTKKKTWSSHFFWQTLQGSWWAIPPIQHLLGSQTQFQCGGGGSPQPPPPRLPTHNTKQFPDTLQMSKNLTHFWHCLPWDSTRFHRFRAQSCKTAPISHFRCQSQASRLHTSEVSKKSSSGSLIC